MWQINSNFGALKREKWAKTIWHQELLSTIFITHQNFIALLDASLWSNEKDNQQTGICHSLL